MKLRLRPDARVNLVKLAVGRCLIEREPGALRALG